MLLNININYLANLRNTIGEGEPDIIKFARYCEHSGADGIVAYYSTQSNMLSSYDIKNLKQHTKSRFILKIAVNEESMQLALDIKPDTVCIVPDTKELSPSIGHNAFKNQKELANFIKPLKEKGILSSVFIDPEIEQVHAAYKSGMNYVELNTMNYSRAFNNDNYKDEFIKLKEAAILANTLGMKVSFCKNINYQNVRNLIKIPSVNEMTIGHGIISKSIYMGIDNSIKEIKAIFNEK